MWVDPVDVAAARESAALWIGWRIRMSIARSKVTCVLTNAATEGRTETILSIPRMAVRLQLGRAKSAQAKLASWMKAQARGQTNTLHS